MQVLKLVVINICTTSRIIKILQLHFLFFAFLFGGQNHFVSQANTAKAFKTTSHKNNLKFSK
jgi:hypothetical protein